MAGFWYELSPRAANAPLHYHHGNEELLFVLDGTPTLRTGVDEKRELGPGDVVAFPAGSAGTHQVVNRSSSAARILICSTNQMPDVAEQIETGLIAIVTPTGLRLFPVDTDRTPHVADPNARD